MERCDNGTLEYFVAWSWPNGWFWELSSLRNLNSIWGFWNSEGFLLLLVVQYAFFSFPMIFPFTCHRFVAGQKDLQSSARYFFQGGCERTIKVYCQMYDDGH